MIYLTEAQVLALQEASIALHGGIRGVRDPGILSSAVAQPGMAFGGIDLYPTLAEKAAALCYSLVNNHAFLDGNKRVGHLAMQTFLLINGFRVAAHVDEQERVIMQVAAGRMAREELTGWGAGHLFPMS